MVEIFIWDRCWLPKAGKNVPTEALKYAESTGKNCLYKTLKTRSALNVNTWKICQIELFPLCYFLLGLVDATIDVFVWIGICLILAWFFDK